MDYQNEYQQEYHEELQKIQDRDFTHNWVSSSAFLFYLQVACIVALLLGGCYKLYEKRYKGKPDVVVPENTLYTPKYK
jgi:G:T-mismatch repair DNA endonuclease (very short patch repair protein)